MLGFRMSDAGSGSVDSVHLLVGYCWRMSKREIRGTNCEEKVEIGKMQWSPDVKVAHGRKDAV